MSSRWKIILAISLALNVFLIGAGAGVLAVGARALGDRFGSGRRDGPPRVQQAFEALPPERRQALREIMRAQALSAAGDFREAAANRRQAAQLIAAEPYDAAAVTAALALARAAEQRGRSQVDATLAARLGALSQAERAVFARVMFRNQGPGARGGAGMGGPGMGGRAFRDGPPGPRPGPADAPPPPP